MDPTNTIVGSSISASLSNRLILEQIFSYLDFNDIKNCRLVNSIWKDEADHRIGNNFYRRVLHQNCINTARLEISYPLPSLPVFKSIMLKSCCYKCTCAWTRNDFCQLFERYQTTMKNLLIKSLITSSRRTMLNFTNCLTRLEILNSSNFSISITFLKNIEWLQLCRGGKIDATDLTDKISPKHLHLHKVEFVSQNQDTNIVNNFVGFSHANYVHLEKLEAKVDMSEDITITTVIMKETKIINPANINWKVSDCEMDHSCVNADISKCGIKKLQFYSSINFIKYLPAELKKLTLVTHYEYENMSCNIIFENLKYLTMVPMLNSINKIIACCPNLKVLEIGKSRHLFRINSINPFPASIKTLILNKNVTIANNFRLSVKNLVLKNYSVKTAEMVYRAVETELVIIKFADMTIHQFSALQNKNRANGALPANAPVSLSIIRQDYMCCFCEGRANPIGMNASDFNKMLEELSIY